jgi:hypothetical protein
MKEPVQSHSPSWIHEVNAIATSLEDEDKERLQPRKWLNDKLISFGILYVYLYFLQIIRLNPISDLDMLYKVLAVRWSRKHLYAIPICTHSWSISFL